MFHRVYFAHYIWLKKVINLNYGEKITDNAVCVVWDKQSLAPGETREFVTYLGVGELTTDHTPPLAVSVFADSFSNKTSNGFTPVTINLFVKNLNNILIHNPFIKLNVPDGFRADITPQIDYSFPFLNTTTPVEFLWVVCPHDDAKPGIYYFEALCGADGIETKSIQFSIELFDSEVDINSFVGLTFSTDYPSVKFMAVDDDTLGVYVDTDSDGTYETIIADSDGTQYGDSNENPELPQEGGEAKTQDGSTKPESPGETPRESTQESTEQTSTIQSQGEPQQNTPGTENTADNTEQSAPQESPAAETLQTSSEPVASTDYGFVPWIGAGIIAAVAAAAVIIMLRKRKA